jgi:subtilisin family serine protease
LSNDSVVSDHPERLGELASIFIRRRIAFAADQRGQVVLVRPDSVVVDAGDSPTSFRQVLAAIGKVDSEQAAQLRKRGRRPGGLVTVTLQNDPVTVHGEERFSVAPVQELVERLRGAGLRSEPNHVVQGSQIVRGVPVGGDAHFAGGMMFTAEIIDSPAGKVMKSTSEPAPAPAWLPQPLGLDPDKHRRPKILILDTGLRTDGTGATVEHPELKCVQLHSPWLTKTSPQIDDEDEYDDDRSGTLDFEAGHGTFIAGIIQQICPDAEVHVAGVLSSFGDGDVANVIASFETAIEQAGGPFDLVVLSLGGYMNDDEGALFETSLLRLVGDGLGVAAAGNQATSRRYFPAAIADVVGVGGLGQADKAWFTNFGGWVDACAPAIDVVSTFFLPRRDIKLNEAAFTGWARWSGTSFAAPKVAAVIAQEMYLTGDDAKTVWRRLSDYRRYRFPDLGTVFNVGP